MSRSSSGSSSAASARTGRASRRRRCLRPGEAVHAANDAAASAQVDIEAALAWRDYMVSQHTDTSAAQWLADRGIDLIRGTGRLAGTGVVEVDGVRHQARHVVVATGADSDAPADPRSRRTRGSLDQPRGDRHARGPAPVADHRRRPGRRRDGPGRVPTRGRGDPGRRGRSRPGPRARGVGERTRRGPAARRRRAAARCASLRARRDGDEYVLAFEDAPDLRGDRLLVATGRHPRVDGIGLETVGISPDPAGIPVDCPPRRGRAALGDRRRHRDLAVDDHRQVPG